MEISFPERALLVRRAAARLCVLVGWAPLHEVPLPNGRRADILALRPDGGFVCIEIKSGPRDFLVDSKWPEYRDFSDALFFAVDADFPLALLPIETGLIVADGMEVTLLREAPAPPVANGEAANFNSPVRDAGRVPPRNDGRPCQPNGGAGGSEGRIAAGRTGSSVKDIAGTRSRGPRHRPLPPGGASSGETNSNDNRGNTGSAFLHKAPPQPPASVVPRLFRGSGPVICSPAGTFDSATRPIHRLAQCPTFRRRRADVPASSSGSSGGWGGMVASRKFRGC